LRGADPRQRQHSIGCRFFLQQHLVYAHPEQEQLREEALVEFTKKTRMDMIDRKIVEHLLAGKSNRAICRDLGAGFRRVTKIKRLAT
jgi:hypothetical protein